ncbi:MAG: UPF0261 family protein, partial [Desulfatiglandales bacterium]
AKGKVEVMIPLGGFSAWDREGKEFYDPEADRHFIESLKRHLSKAIPVTEYGFHINDESFADSVYERFTQIVK